MPGTNIEDHTEPAPKKKCNVCTDFKVLRKKYNKEGSSALLATNATSEPASAQMKPTAYAPFPCPPDSGELGSSTWTFLHTMAAYYPETPTPADKTSMSGFLSALGRFYPCWYCASHFKEYAKTNPPRLDSNVELSQWFCEVHNEVNDRLGKPTFDCSKVLQRWKEGAPGNKCFE